MQTGSDDERVATLVMCLATRADETVRAAAFAAVDAFARGDQEGRRAKIIEFSMGVGATAVGECGIDPNLVDPWLEEAVNVYGQLLVGHAFGDAVLEGG